jgi:hypothetical protein
MLQCDAYRLLQLAVETELRMIDRRRKLYKLEPILPNPAWERQGDEDEHSHAEGSEHRQSYSCACRSLCEEADQQVVVVSA